MIYLLDVNVLLGLLQREHVFHERVAFWIRDILVHSTSNIATCSITELGAVRILPQLPESGYTVAESAFLVTQFKQSLGLKHLFLADNMGVESIPKWVKTAKQTTDGHLSELARSYGGVLATLDGKIPNSMVIPVLK